MENISKTKLKTSTPLGMKVLLSISTASLLAGVSLALAVVTAPTPPPPLPRVVITPSTSTVSSSQGHLVPVALVDIGGYINLYGPTITEQKNTAQRIGTGTFNLIIPNGFAFDTSSNVQLNSTPTPGSTCDTTNNTGLQLANSQYLQTSTSTATTISFTFTKSSQGTCYSTLTFSGIRIKPLVKSPLAVGNINNSGTARIPFVNGKANFGTLRAVNTPLPQTITTTTTTPTTGSTGSTTPTTSITMAFGPNARARSVSRNPVSVTLPTLTNGSYYYQTITVAGGTQFSNGGYRWDITAGSLPVGWSPSIYHQSGLTTWSLSNGDSDKPGFIPGTYNFTLTVTDAVGATLVQDFSLIVVNNPTYEPVVISVANNLTATVGASFNTMLSGYGASGYTFYRYLSWPLSWSITSGALPPGLSLNVANRGGGATISGTPTTAGTYNFTVTNIDGRGARVNKDVSICVVGNDSMSFGCNP